MCEASIYVDHRNATDKERLIVRKVPTLRMKGYYPANGRYDNRLVCIHKTVKAVIKEVHFEPGMHNLVLGNWEGKRDIEVTLRHKPYRDFAQFPDGAVVYLMNIASGVRIDIGYPMETHAPGMKVVEASIVEALALPPDPKPEDDQADRGKGEEHHNQPGDEPASEPAPAREPESSLVRAVRDVFGYGRIRLS